MQYHEEDLKRGCICIMCAILLPKNRQCFPWGSKKPKVCVDCINKEFYAILEELNIDFAGIDEQVNGCI